MHSHSVFNLTLPARSIPERRPSHFLPANASVHLLITSLADAACHGDGCRDGKANSRVGRGGGCNRGSVATKESLLNGKSHREMVRVDSSREERWIRSIQFAAAGILLRPQAGG